MKDWSKNVAFLGGFYPDDSSVLQEDAKTSLDYAADAYQKKYIYALKNIGIENLQLFSRLFLGSWPLRSRKLFVKYESIRSMEKTIYIDYFNLIGVRDVWQCFNTVKTVIDWYHKLSERDEAVLFVYSANFSREVIKIKKKAPNLKICLIIPDLPIYTYLSETGLVRRYIRNRRQNMFIKSCFYVDRCICITEQMRQYIQKVASVKCIVIEAIAHKERCLNSLLRLQQDVQINDDDNAITIAYTGTLSKKYGIVELIDTFEKLGTVDCKLVICGGGDAEYEVRKRAQNNSKICYLGVVSNDEAKKIQEESDILVNPRNAEDDYTAFSFPSKTMEYLETGNIVVCYKLPGIPDEYCKRLICVDNNIPDGLVFGLRRAINMTKGQRRQQGTDNIKYLLEHKCGEQLKDIIFEIFSNK